jgi:cytochrome c
MIKGFAAAAILLACSAGGVSAEDATPAQAPAPAAPAATPAPAAPAATPAPAAAPAAPAAPAADIAAGEISFKKCMACHRIGEGAKNFVGPELNGLDGRKAGSVEGFNYSDANKNSGITWGEDVFKEYITNPRAKIPNTKMTFAGISSANERANLWAYIKQFDATGKKK